MIIECPTCSTRYDMKIDTPYGRSIRCAKCGQVWRYPAIAEQDVSIALPWFRYSDKNTRERTTRERLIFSESKIFMSYRRTDSKAVATLIYGPLSKHFEAKYDVGAVFVDVEGIPLGLDFRQYLTEQVSQTELLLALIADRWLTATDDNGNRRLDDPNDFVRIEIEAALKRNIPVVPLYIDGAGFLKERDLPEALKPLAWRNGYSLDTDSRFFESHISRLIAGIEPHLSNRNLI